MARHLDRVRRSQVLHDESSRGFVRRRTSQAGLSSSDLDAMGELYLRMASDTASWTLELRRDNDSFLAWANNKARALVGATVSSNGKVESETVAERGELGREVQGLLALVTQLHDSEGIRVQTPAVVLSTEPKIRPVTAVFEGI